MKYLNLRMIEQLLLTNSLFIILYIFFRFCVLYFKVPDMIKPDLLRDTFEAKKRMLYNGKCVRH